MVGTRFHGPDVEILSFLKTTRDFFHDPSLLFKRNLQLPIPSTLGTFMYLSFSLRIPTLFHTHTPPWPATFWSYSTPMLWL